MTYHHKSGLGQTSTPDMVFSLTDPDVAAMQAPAPTTTTATTGTKTATTSTSGGGKGAPASYLMTSPSSSLITSAAYSSAPADSTPHWLPWAIGGGVAGIGLALIFAARS